MSEALDDLDGPRPNLLATVSLVSGILALIGQLASCLLCWIPVVGWIAPLVVLIGTAIGLATGMAGRNQALQTGIGGTAAELGVALALVNLAIEALLCLGFMVTCFFPTFLTVMDV